MSDFIGDGQCVTHHYACECREKMLADQIAWLEEALRQCAIYAGADGTDPDDWRATVGKAGAAIWAVRDARDDYDTLIKEHAKLENAHRRCQALAEALEEKCKKLSYERDELRSEVSRWKAEALAARELLTRQGREMLIEPLSTWRLDAYCAARAANEVEE